MQKPVPYNYKQDCKKFYQELAYFLQNPSLTDKDRQTILTKQRELLKKLSK